MVLSSRLHVNDRQWLQRLTQFQRAGQEGGGVGDEGCV